MLLKFTLVNIAFNLKTLCIVYKASKMFEIKENSVVTSFSAV